MIRFLKKHSFLLYCFLIAAGFLLVCSKSSPLYPMNDWVDVNCFFTMGKSLLKGQVPYRDLYEQKGPVLYFIYAALALFSRNSYFGVYLLEVLTYGLFLYYSGKIAGLYLREALTVWLLVTIEGGLIVISRAFAHGASVEEMCLFLSAYGLYVALHAMKKERALSFREACVCGVFAGILLWIKYTMLGLYLGLAVFILVWYLGWGLGWKALGKTIGGFFTGLGMVSAVVFLYFLLNGALGDLFTVYFYNNIFLYAREAEQPRLAAIWDCLKLTLKNNPSYNLLLIPGLIWALIRAAKDLRPLLLLSLCFCGLALGTYWGGWSISYYGLVFAVFAIFGLIAIGELVQRSKLPNILGSTRLLFALCTLVAVMAMMDVCLFWGRNLYMLGQKKETMPQYQFAKIIRETEDATLLNYGFLDGGFYYAADIIPNCRFFCILNVQAPDMWDTQRQYVAEGKVDYVVTRDKPLTEYQVDSSLYEYAAEGTQYFEGKLRTYYLYRLKSAPS